MFLTILSYRFPDLPGALRTAMQALIWSIALLAALALCVAVWLAVAPYLPTLLIGVGVTGLYAIATCPRKAVRS